MRKAMLCVGLLLVVLGVTDVAAESYRVILKNGSWVQAREKPDMDGDKARIRLSGGGVAVVSGASVDWEATENWNKTHAVAAGESVDEAQAVDVPSGTVTMVREDDQEAAPGAEGATPEGDVEAADTPQPAPDNLGEKRQRYQTLEGELTRLRREKSELEGRASNVVNLDEARRLRSQAADLDTRIQQILAEQKNLILEGDTATSNVGEDAELRRRLRFLNAEIAKLRTEKVQLDRQAANMLNLDEAKVVRAKSDALFSRIQAHEAERDRLMTRQSQQEN